MGKKILWIFENWLDILEAIEDEKDRARVWLLLIESTFERRQVDLSKENMSVKIGFNSLCHLSKMRKMAGRKKQEQQQEQEQKLSLAERAYLEDLKNGR